MVHDSQLTIPRIVVCSGNCRNSAGERSTSPAILCKLSDMFACCSIRFIATASICSPSALHIFSLRRSARLDRIEHHQPSNFLRERAMRTSIALSFALFLTNPVIAWAEDQAITVGPWTIATSSRGDKFDSCTMSRSTNDLDVSFIRDQDGLIHLLESSKWRLERGRRLLVV